MRWIAAVTMCAAVAAVGAEASAWAAEEARRAQVTTRFRWPRSLTLDVDVTIARGSRIGPETIADRAEASYRLVYARHGATGEVRAEAVEIEAPTPTLSGLAFGIFGQFEVDRAGAFAELHDPQGFSAKVLDEVGAAGLHAEVRDAFTPAALEEAARTDWTALVSRWAGQQFVEDRPRIVAGELDLMNRSDLAVGTVVEEGLDAMVPCAEGEAPRCARFVRTETLDPSAKQAIGAAILEGILAQAGLPPASGGPEVRDVQVTTTTELVTDPKTLVPRSLVKRRSILLELGLQGESIEIEQFDETSRVYAISE